MKKDVVYLRYYSFYLADASGARQYLTTTDAIAALHRGGDVALEGRDLGGRDLGGRVIGTNDQNPLVVYEIALNEAGRPEVIIDHPWWYKAVCEKQAVPMGTGVPPLDLSGRIHTLTPEHALRYGC